VPPALANPPVARKPAPPTIPGYWDSRSPRNPAHSQSQARLQDSARKRDAADAAAAAAARPPVVYDKSSVSLPAVLQDVPEHVTQLLYSNYAGEGQRDPSTILRAYVLRLHQEYRDTHERYRESHGHAQTLSEYAAHRYQECRELRVLYGGLAERYNRCREEREAQAAAVAKLEADKETMAALYAECREQLGRYQREAQGKHDELAAGRQRDEALIRKVEKHMGAADALRKQLAGMEAQVEALKERNNELLDKVDDVERSNAYKESQCEVLRLKNAALAEEVEVLSSQHDAQFFSLNSRQIEAAEYKRAVDGLNKTYVRKQHSGLFFCFVNFFLTLFLFLLFPQDHGPARGRPARPRPPPADPDAAAVRLHGEAPPRPRRRRDGARGRRPAAGAAARAGGVRRAARGRGAAPHARQLAGARPPRARAGAAQPAAERGAALQVGRRAARHRRHAHRAARPPHRAKQSFFCAEHCVGGAGDGRQGGEGGPPRRRQAASTRAHHGRHRPRARPRLPVPHGAVGGLVGGLARLLQPALHAAARGQPRNGHAHAGEDPAGRR
jgi:predicted  nucleic acid-binding Zn-ribbon protein